MEPLKDAREPQRICRIQSTHTIRSDECSSRPAMPPLALGREKSSSLQRPVATQEL